MATNYNVLSAPPEGCSPPPAPTPSQNISSQYASPNVITQRDHWTYRYSPGGERELKRLMIAALYPDAASCGAVPWVGTLQGVGDVPVAIFHGRQTQSPEGCNHTAYNSVVDQNRRVMLYSYEFRSYGPDGIALLFQRNNATGVMEKRFPIQDYQGSIVAVTGPVMTVPISTAYTTFGTPTPDGKERSTVTSTWLEQSRTAFMDKCIDWETAPFTGMEEYQLYDVSARKYQAATGTFITPDPLWVVSPGSGSYTYANHDPINLIDPSGLAPEGSGQPLTEDGTEVVAGRPIIIPKTDPDPGAVKPAEDGSGVPVPDGGGGGGEAGGVTGQGIPEGTPEPPVTADPTSDIPGLQEFMDDSYAAVNAIHAEWDAATKSYGTERGNPGDGNSGGQRYGEEKGKGGTNSTKVIVLSRSVGGYLGNKSSEGHLGVVVPAEDDHGQRHNYVVQGGPDQGKLTGSVRQASKKGWYYDFSQSKGSNWSEPNAVNTLPVYVVGEGELENPITLTYLQSIVQGLNSSLKPYNYDYGNGPNSNSFVYLVLQKLGLNITLDSSENSWKGVPWAISP